MKRFLLYALLPLLLLSSCVSEEGDRMVSGEEVYMNVSTRGLDASMTQVRFIVTDATSGQVLINQYPIQPESSGEYRLSVRTGQLNFYVVLNEPTTLTPLLSAIAHNSAIAALVLNSTALPATEDSDDLTTQTNLPAIGWSRAIIRASAGDIKYGEASVDGGSTWNNTLYISLERLATKISLALRKNTSTESDEITVNRITAVNIPQYGFLLPKAYESTEFDSEILYDSPIQFAANTDYYTQMFADVVLPEYLPVSASDKESALCLKLEATYNQKNVVYYIPVRGDLEEEDYSMKRNNHYLMKATLATGGEMIYIPEVKYQVADWTAVDIDPEFVEQSAITFSRSWETGTNISGTDIYVENNGYIDFYFTLTRPKGASWTATLTNGIDFMFDETDGAVSGGIAREGHVYKIRIRPRRETQLNGVNTEFYITVDNGATRVELNLPSQSVGTKDRYTIIQIPG